MFRCSFMLGLLALSATAGIAAAADPGPLTIGIVTGGGPGGEALIAGAERAAREWNSSAAAARRPVRLRVLEPARPWDDGAARMARLVFDGDVAAVIGDDDATLAHVAAQITTVKRIPFFSLSPEDGLTRVFDPWIFRGVPADRVQATTLLRHALGRTDGRRVVAVVPPGRDGRERSSAIRSACADLGVELVAISQVPTGGAPALPPSPAATDAVLAWVDAVDAVTVLRHVARSSPGTAVLGSSRIDTASIRAAATELGVSLVLLASGPEAAGYDLVRMVAGAAGEAGGDPDAIRRAVAAHAGWRGRSGSFRFDDRGNRIGEIPVLVIGDDRAQNRPSPLGGA